MTNQPFGFLYTLTLQEPVLTGSLSGDPNSASSQRYIPGGAVRGAAIQAYTKKKEAADKDFSRLFLSGETRFLNAYPMIKDKRTLPTPLAWQTERKPNPKAKKLVYRDAQAATGLDTKSASFKAWTLGADKLSIPQDLWQVNVHTQRDAVHGRALTKPDPENKDRRITLGAVYRYIALPAGLKLQGIVLTQNQNDADGLAALLKAKPILLGKARTAGYGHATVKTMPLPENWRESGQILQASAKFTLTLLSPAIVRDANGQNSLDIQPALQAHLGDSIKVTALHREAEVISGFNRQWGLPLPQVTAIATGSVFHIEANADTETLLKLEASGIGERRAEGFGRVAVNLSLPKESMEWEKISPDLAPPPSEVLASNDPLARQMLARLMRHNLDQQVLLAARNITAPYKGGLSNSQLSRWRVIVRDALGRKDEMLDGKKYDMIGRVKAFFDAENKKKSPAWKKMEKARLSFHGSPRLTEWMEELLTEPKALERSWENFTPTRALGEHNTLSVDADLNAEYRLRLLDAVLEILSKMSGGKNER